MEYFIEFSEVTPEIIEKWQEENFIISEFELNKDHKGILVDGSIIKKALNSIDAMIAHKRETNYEGIMQLFLHPKDTSKKSALPNIPRVIIRSWNSMANNKSFAKIVEQILLPILNRTINIYTMQGKTQEPIEDGSFNIFLYSASSGKKSQEEMPKTLWGIDVSARSQYYQPTGQALVTIHDEDRGFPVAEVIGNNLYVFYDISYKGSAHELELFKIILEETIFELTTAPEDKNKKRKEIAAQKKEASLNNYINTCLGNSKRSLQQTEADIEHKEAIIADLKRKIMDENDRLQSNLQKIEGFKSLVIDHNKVYSEEFDQLWNHPQIREIRVTNDILNIYTETLYCFNPGNNMRHLLGEFRIEISMAGDSGRTRFFNLTQRIKGHDNHMHAPHIFYKGQTHNQKISNELNYAITELDFVRAADQAIKFIERVDKHPSELTKYTKRWPEAPIEEETEKDTLEEDNAEISEAESEQRERFYSNYGFHSRGVVGR